MRGAKLKESFFLFFFVCLCQHDDYTVILCGLTRHEDILLQETVHLMQNWEDMQYSGIVYGKPSGVHAQISKLSLLTSPPMACQVQPLESWDCRQVLYQPLGHRFRAEHNTSFQICNLYLDSKRYLEVPVDLRISLEVKHKEFLSYTSL